VKEPELLSYLVILKRLSNW